MATLRNPEGPGKLCLLATKIGIPRTLFEESGFGSPPPNPRRRNQKQLISRASLLPSALPGRNRYDDSHGLCCTDKGGTDETASRSRLYLWDGSI
ncbi:hypothetical protein MLD38_016225 [Melastoma candidum]|uniref:Uncharacterized protein n=1 Tax=Melastoma candidum TaxID=119954 RepID=A0ACB9RIW3_9MYRT|nr:hypothetical protein MLD38_016225 [Melastoma candidum]